MNVPPDITDRAKLIRLALFDVDGVLTDGKVILDSTGKELKIFNIKDGHGIRLLQHYGIEVGVITGRSSKALEHRMNDLEVKHVIQGCNEKFNAYQNLLRKLKIKENETSFVGDDIVDLQIMSRCGLAIAVSDAHEFVKKHAHWETSASGGQGAVREVCELILESQGLLKKALSYNLS